MNQNNGSDQSFRRYTCTASRAKTMHGRSFLKIYECARTIKSIIKLPQSSAIVRTHRLHLTFGRRRGVAVRNSACGAHIAAEIPARASHVNASIIAPMIATFGATSTRRSRVCACRD